MFFGYTITLIKHEEKIFSFEQIHNREGKVFQNENTIGRLVRI